MPIKATLIKAVDNFVKHNSVVDGVTAPFLFVGCESGGHAFIRNSVICRRMPQYLKNCYIEFLWNREYLPIEEDMLEHIQLCKFINRMFLFDKSLIQVRMKIKSIQEIEYVRQNTESALQKIQAFLFDEIKRQYEMKIASLSS